MPHFNKPLMVAKVQQTIVIGKHQAILEIPQTAFLDQSPI